MSRLIIAARHISSIREATKVLRVSPDDISIATIKNAYYEQSKALHPDKNLGTDTTARFATLNRAYEYALAHVDKFEKRQQSVREKRAQRPVTLGRGFGKRHVNDKLTRAQGYTPSHNADHRVEAMKGGTWLPPEGAVRKDEPKEKVPSNYGLTDEHKYVPPDKTIDYRLTEYQRKNRAQKAVGDGFMNMMSDNFKH